MSRARTPYLHSNVSAILAALGRPLNCRLTHCSVLRPRD